MKPYYPGPKKFGYLIKRISLSVALLISVMFSASAQNLVFKNPVLISGTAGKDGAVYRFPQITTNVDALVQISGRSSSLVQLVTIDLADKGWDKSFQPQVTYNNGTTPAGTNDWYMEFQISFVKSNTVTPVIVNKFDITALDIDGNGDQLNEWVSFYNLKTSVIEVNSLLKPSTILESILGLLTIVGKKYEGPTSNFVDIDTAATRVMVSTSYENINQFKVRTGGHSVGQQGAADRMYSLFFKSFSFQKPVLSSLPVIVSSFTAKKTDNKAILNWTTEQEKNLSHFVIERSFDGTEFTDAGVIFTDGNSDKVKEYTFTNDLQLISKPIVYYRLKMVDMDGQSERSAIRIIKTSADKQTVNILVYPNPAVNDLRITYPQTWQDKKVTIDLVNANGQTVKHVVDVRAGQTETLNVSDLLAGIYFVRVTNGTETAVQRIVKTK